MKKSILTITLVLISLCTQAQNSLFLTTAYGIFTSCEVAAKFREGRLFEMLDKAFVSTSSELCYVPSDAAQAVKYQINKLKVIEENCE
jgi:hypothetical protein